MIEEVPPPGKAGEAQRMDCNNISSYEVLNPAIQSAQRTDLTKDIASIVLKNPCIDKNDIMDYLGLPSYCMMVERQEIAKKLWRELDLTLRVMVKDGYLIRKHGRYYRSRTTLMLFEKVRE